MVEMVKFFEKILIYLCASIAVALPKEAITTPMKFFIRSYFLTDVFNCLI